MTLKEKIESNEFIICGEIGPPQSCNGKIIVEKSKHFKGYVDAVNITDNQTATVKLSSIASAKILIDENIEPIMQITCRDRNRLAIQSDLLGAAALGITNVLCLTGDHQTLGDQPEAKGVFDLDSIQLISAVNQLNNGYLLSGKEMKCKTTFLIGAAENPFAEPFEMRLIRIFKKIDAGARFIQTQAIFDLEIFCKWMEKVVEMGLHKKAAILAGVMPIKSIKTLQWMKERVPGIRINNDIVDRMKNTKSPEDEGIKIAVETIKTIKNLQGISGIHLMPTQWESITPTILKEAGLILTN